MPTETHAGHFGTYRFDESGILMCDSNAMRRTLETARENIAMIKRISGDKPVCLLVHLKLSPKPDKPTREYIAGELPKIYKAMAMVSKAGLGQFIMALLFKLQSPPIPMRCFSNEAAAKEWLRQFL